jgi:adenylate cyclase
MDTEAHTFLFADLVGYTALTDEQGDERAAGVALEFQRRARELADRHGAEAVKTLGDAVMLRCPEAAGGIRLGLGLVEELASDPGLPPVRVGVHAGSAVARDGDWFGHGVNVAARLCSVAAGGEVLVSEAAWEAAGELDAIAVGERRLHWLKNVTEPVPVRPASIRPRSPRRRRLWCRNSRKSLRARVA